MNKENNQKKDFLWNAVGSLLYALASIVLAFAVIRIVGDNEGGIFGFGFSTLGQQMFIVAYFGIRPFHITDRTPEYSFGDYLGTRRLTSLLAVLGSLLFLGVQLGTGQYSLHKALILCCSPCIRSSTAMPMSMNRSCNARTCCTAAASRSPSVRASRS